MAASWELVTTSQFSLASCLTFIPASPGRPGSPTAPGGPCKKMPSVPPTARAGLDCKGGDNLGRPREGKECAGAHIAGETQSWEQAVAFPELGAGTTGRVVVGPGVLSPGPAQRLLEPAPSPRVWFTTLGAPWRAEGGKSMIHITTGEDAKQGCIQR